jgi:hypothetical protein
MRALVLTQETQAVSPQAKTEVDQRKSEFEQAGEQQQLSLIQEFYAFVLENKAWWLVPILLVFGCLGLLIVLGSTGAAPFIYTLF